MGVFSSTTSMMTSETTASRRTLMNLASIGLGLTGPTCLPGLTGLTGPLLLALASPTVIIGVAEASKATTIQKTFRFKDDFFLRFSPLTTAIAPTNTPQLFDALEAYGETFRDRWVEALEVDLEVEHEGKCYVMEMSIPRFSMCDWRYPDHYDTSVLPTPGQSYIDPDKYVQRLYYSVESLIIACEGTSPDYFTYQNLDKDTYTQAAFAGSDFLELINPPSSGCDGDPVTCLFSTTETIEYDIFREENAQLFVHRFTEVPMYLKCLDLSGYGPDVANVLIEAMDRFFEGYVEVELEGEILENAPGGSVYNFASPYDKDRSGGERKLGSQLGDTVGDKVGDGSGRNVRRLDFSSYDGSDGSGGMESMDITRANSVIHHKTRNSNHNSNNPDRIFFTHGPYYTAGNIVSQVPDDDGILVTEYTYGFDVIWFWPPGATDNIIPDVPSSVNAVFKGADGNAFLDFLKMEYSEYDYVQRAEVCEPVNGLPSEPELPTGTRAPTDNPTSKPTKSPTAKPTVAYGIGQGPCMDDTECEDGLICHQHDPLAQDEDAVRTCECHVETNGGCNDGKVCEIYETHGIPKCYCDIYNDGGTNGCNGGKVCRFSCAYTALNPRCFDDEFIRDCVNAWGEGHTCADSNGDGVIDENDQNGGCDYHAPTASPTTRPPTISPVVTITDYPTSSPEQYIPETPQPSKSPVGSQPAITAEPTTAMPTSWHPTSANGLPATPNPTDYPTAISTLFPTLPGTRQSCDSASDADNANASPYYPSSQCNNEYCCINDMCQPCITIPGDCTCQPLVATCGNGNVGDGICKDEGYCCSKWGWCGTTEEYCEDDQTSKAPTPFLGGYRAPTPSLDAGKCGNATIGEGLCADPTHCCSQWGYCGPGEGYCYTVDDGTKADGTCGAGGVGDGICRTGHCCSIYGFCGEGEEYCTGNNPVDSTPEELERAEEVVESSPLPPDLIPQFGFRCGFSELDARGNCKPECIHTMQCENGEECHGIQLNYCHTFQEGSHPQCVDLEKGNTDRRCGFEEVDARELCGTKCDDDSVCGQGQRCFPTIANLCDCFEEMGASGEIFETVRNEMEPYFLGSAIAENGSPIAVEGDGTVEGKPRNGAVVMGGIHSNMFFIGSMFVSSLMGMYFVS